jgi:hypothetical protein
VTSSVDATAYSRLDDISGEVWDALVPPEFFFQRDFLRVMEASGVEEARYRYLVLHEREVPVGIAVLSAFTLRLDLLSGEKWVARLRRWMPGLLDVPIVCCGIPASFGQHHLHVKAHVRLGEAFRCVHREMDAWAAQEGQGLLVWKEWSPEQGVGERAAEDGYVVLPTLPDYVIDPLPETVEAFVGALRSDYRRKFKRAVQIMTGEGPTWTHGAYRLEEGAFAESDAEEFYRGYLKVMDRTAVRLETYPRAFFDNLARSDLAAFTLRIVNESVGGSILALLIPGGRTLSFVLVAKEHARYDDALYTLLLQCVVLYSVRRGFCSVRLGQTSSYAKSSVGAEPRHLETFLAMRTPLKHQALKWVGPQLFPATRSPDLRVFSRLGEAQRIVDSLGREV